MDTTHNVPENVMSASDRPFGEGDMCVNGPRPSRWSTVSRESTERMEGEEEGEMRTSVCLETDRSGAMTAHD